MEPDKTNSPSKKEIMNMKDMKFKSTLIEELFPNDSPEKKSDESKIFKMTKLNCVFDPKIKLYDAKLNGKGFDEDIFFINNPECLKILRRGNTIIELAKGQRFIGRKGFQKFFDLSFSFLEFHLKDTAIKDNEKQRIRDIIFKGIEQAYKDGCTIKLYQTEKANGENCQISYISRLDSWLISSKNVSILARTRKEIDEYEKQYLKELNLKEQEELNRKKEEELNRKEEELKQKLEKDGENKELEEEEKKTENQNKEKEKEKASKKEKNYTRFSFVKLIANEWFNIVEKIKHIKGLKKTLSNKTLVGEYCGNSEHQHLIKYNEISIYFYCLVENYGEASCLPPQKVIKLCKTYGLKPVKFSEKGTYKNFQSLNKELEKIYEDISKETLDVGGEGCVLYFIRENNNEKKEEVLSLCKVKTLEYRIYRKMREKIKSLYSKKNQDKMVDDAVKKFGNETKKLCEHFNPPLPIEEYVNFANYCLKFAKSHPKIIDLINKKYTDFLSKALLLFNTEYKEKEIELTEESIFHCTE